MCEHTSKVAVLTSSRSANPRPLFVDLDGTLVKTDTLIDSLLLLVRKHPRLICALPRQLLRGKAAFKAFVAQEISLDVEHLAYNYKLLQYLRDQRAEGRDIYLATGADIKLARRVAHHLGIFSGVLSSDGRTNLTRYRKLDRIRNQVGGGEFEYVGNASPDLPLLVRASGPMIANPSLMLRWRLRRHGIRPKMIFEDRTRSGEPC